ncbi:MAG: phage head morphogenesis protein [Oscillospiraceae bacterium]|nr:phage head morphogenesis protein [Oscillospiraceae bacterium]
MDDAKVCRAESKADAESGTTCYEKHGQIYPITETVDPAPPLHPHCRCRIETMDAKKAGTATALGINGADYYLAHTGQLPDYYVTSSEAESNYGWNPGANTLGETAQGKMIGGDVYENRNGHLPDAPGRIWYEAGINYVGGSRGDERTVYSNDGLIFVTYDDYRTFIEITGTDAQVPKNKIPKSKSVIGHIFRNKMVICQIQLKTDNY